MPYRLDSRNSRFAEDFAAFLEARREGDEDVERQVAQILEAVRRDGDRALFAYSERFDGLRLTPETLRVGAVELEAAERAVPEPEMAALRFAAERIAAFHQRQKPEDFFFVDEAGVGLGQRWTALDAVGLYVPGGTAAYPSSVLMNAVPARVAGVGRIAMAVPAPAGELNPLVLAAARLAGVAEIYRMGGAQAVGALAFGTASVAAVDKIVGPGNAYVAAAKRQVFGRVGIDSIAGPSEILVVADEENDPAWIAADLLSQAEHDSAAQAILVTDARGFAEKVEEAIAAHLETLTRREVAAASWERHGAVIIVEDLLSEAPALVDRIAPEHLELALSDPESVSSRVRHAGAIFLGRHTPEAVGDYVAGPNHVLPTARTARFSSGLSVLDFMKRTSLVGCDGASLARIGPAAARLAEAEGLPAHALSITLRLAKAP